MVEPALLSDAALALLRRRYLRRDKDGTIVETPDQMFHRVAQNVAAVNEFHGDRSARKDEEEFYRAMRELEFLPNSPTLMNAGTDIQQLSACFVVPVEDSIEGIYDAVKYTALIHQTGGGVGLSFSRLRPAGDVVCSTGGAASGPVSFMKVFDAATEAIRQGGRRRGANMGVLRVDHPDIEGFVAAKEDLVSLPNFNISVAATDEFMDRAAEGEDIELINPRTGKGVRRVNAAMLLEQISANAWRSGDPGMIFIDTINQHNPTPRLGAIEATNPCGEVPLLPYEACNLGSINLERMMGEDGRALDWAKFERIIEVGVRFLDNVIDANRYPLPQTEKMVRGNRKIGLGLMGFADLLLRLGIRYGSPESLAVAEEITSFLYHKAEKVSAEIAESRGSFPFIEESIFDGPRRNATLLSMAPTGTISMIAGCSSGIEPLYAIAYGHNVIGGRVEEVNAYFLAWGREERFLTPSLMREVRRRHSIKDLEEIPASVREIFVTAHDIPAVEQVNVQAAFQRHVDNAVSKTINLPASASLEEVRDAFMHAHRQGCKGVTVYREGSRRGQVLTIRRGENEYPTCGRHVEADGGPLECNNC
ncbi:MAG: adenosylcobalamin-dependent ribonucleoside-diphosphate reductase [Euryarchaeota archaeon]|nr:adenosylcobalamin-dependent ribonucleoside-diphosphate reductase [Euryarchaeota archaeon]